MSMPLVAGLSVAGMNSKSPAVKSYVCMVGWDQLQLIPFGPLIENNPIDQALISGKAFRVRLNFGRYSPDFVTQLAGSTVAIHDPTDGNNAIVPIWWSEKVKLAQTNLITRLADKYDGKISSIFMGANMTIYCEPFIRQTGSSTTVANLIAAGYTESYDMDSFNDMLNMFSAFSETRLAQSFNPYQYVQSITGMHGEDVDYTNHMMQTLRALRPDSILQNNSIRYPVLKGNYPTMYNAMKGEKPLSFQTAQASRIGDWSKTLEWAVGMGAHLVELAPGYDTALTLSQLESFDKQLRANV